ncbi:AAA family ATPase [Nannocystis pusilla]|uniref:AAA family ATPase n=1 Tax=Nannocystis pusilla TaxID=889268 RepID=UPI003BF04574
MFEVVEKLEEVDGTAIYRGVRASDGCPVVLKVLDLRRCSARALEQLKNDFEIARTLDVPTAVKPLALDSFHGMPALVFEDFAGVPLDRLLGAPMALERFLPLAIRIAEAVVAIHRGGFVHRGLKPHNILVQPATFDVKIADFGIAFRLPRMASGVQPAGLMEGPLTHMSPEQTARINLAIDTRSDLYSLGVTFYEMLTGRLPFLATDPLELVHSHIACPPVAPTALVPAIPDAVAAIVMKLLAKSTEDRYQTAVGLRHDLVRCFAEWEVAGRIQRFALGASDVPDRLLVPRKLYGRDESIAALQGAFERVVATGSPALVLIAGSAGVGKSALVHEVHRRIVGACRFFAAGKFDQYRRDIPYATLAQAGQELVLQILAESDEHIAAWRERLLEALDGSGRLLFDLIPRLELLLGPQPEVPDAPPSEAQNRFQRVFLQFIGVFARREHPAALFLDDLQWVDSASLTLLARLATRREAGCLLLVGAYRDNEVTASHPLRLALDEARKVGAVIEELSLAPLSVTHTGQLIADLVHQGGADVAPLARLVHDKTAGNPFFALQFLAELSAEGLLEFDPRAAAWRWDLGKIQAKGYTDNVVDLMVAKLRRLSPAARDMVAVASCMGDAADVRRLALLESKAEDDVHHELSEAVHEGLLGRFDGAYRFPHDRVQEAAYALVPAESQAERELRIGRLLLSCTSPAELRERVFDVAIHLNRGGSRIVDVVEKRAAAEVNRLAGERAMASAAFGPAATFLAAGITHLGPGCLETQYDLAFELHLQQARCELSAGALGAAERLISALLGAARGRHHRALVCLLQVKLNVLRGTMHEAVRVALEACPDLFGIHMEAHPSAESVREAIDEVWTLLGRRPIETLLNRPRLVDPVMHDAAVLLTTIFPAVFFTGEVNLYDLLICELARITLEHGNSEVAPFAYVKLGELAVRRGLADEARRLGSLAEALVERDQLAAVRAKIQYILTTFISFWLTPPRESLVAFERAAALAASDGDLIHETYGRVLVAVCAFAAGVPLADVVAATARAADLQHRTRVQPMLEGGEAIARLARELSGAEEAAPQLQAVTPAGRFFQCSYESIGCLLRGDPREAVRLALEARELVAYAHDHPQLSEYTYYAGLAFAAEHDTAPPSEQTTLRAYLADHLERLRGWAEMNPMAQRHRHSLLAAELARIEGRADEAMRLYDQAIQQAEEQDAPHHQAIACETAASFFRARERGRVADAYLSEARTCYARWGAHAKVADLERRYSHLAQRAALSPTATFAARAEHFDLWSVIKASQSISGELVLDRLLRALLRVLLESSGAQRGCLLLVRDGALSLAAEAAFEGASIEVQVPVDAPSAAQLVPASVVNTVWHTREAVVLDDAAAAGRFTADPWIAARHARSVLGLPILRQAEAVGVLYLENNLVRGAFTPDRLAVLEVLAAQAAISLQNAWLLAEAQVARTRAAFLAEASQVLAESLEYDQVLRELAQIAVRQLCDWCVIDLVEQHEIRRLAGAHAERAKQPLLDELRLRYPPMLSSPHPGVKVLETGEARLIDFSGDADLRASCVDDEHARLIRELGIHSLIVVPLVARGQTLGVLSLVSARPGRFRRADLELAQEFACRAAIYIENARLYREAQEAVRLRDEFLSIASHELRTPVNSLQLVVQGLTRGAAGSSPERTLRALALAERQIVRMTRLIEELLEVSRLQVGRLELHVEPLELGAVVCEVVERFEAELARSGCPLALRVGRPVRGSWDRHRLEQVVTNLVSNALKFGAGRPIEISVDEQPPGTGRLLVRDHGIGIPPDRLPYIFDRFERAVSARQYGGLGLGLYIVRTIVEAFGGVVRADSVLGSGATFTVELPCAGPASPRLDRGRGES